MPVPLFDNQMTVQFYQFSYHDGNDLYHTNSVGYSFDGATYSPLLEILNKVGIEAFTAGKPIFVPVSNIMLLMNLDMQCRQPSEKIVFLLGSGVKPVEPYLSRVAYLREKGFRFALREVEDLSACASLLAFCDYLLVDYAGGDLQRWEELLADVAQYFDWISIVMTGIETKAEYERLREKNIDLFGGQFYTMPITQSKAKPELKPMKANLVRLLNILGDDDFGLDLVASIVGRDPALIISLMRMVNSPYLSLRNRVKTVSHAVAMLGQVEMRKWARAAVFKSLCVEKPDEFIRISLLRAKFCENLASCFGLQKHSESLFLMGLFSVVDLVMDMPMEQALEIVLVTEEIQDALLHGEGPFAPAEKMVRCYERADWTSVSRLMILHNILPDSLHRAFIDTTGWYSDLINEEVKPIRRAVAADNLFG
ncbi:HDOD domain-containing protein [Oscillospiraceae bacterium MB08-C2-2]|nr:HDOD domain-containing protein [Oscillospiraceae bacterium MB08-C2-2]